MNAKEKLLEREREIIRLLNIFIDSQFDFIVVGGYAIATYQKRFSIDLDLVIKEKDLKEFEKTCKKEGYVEGYNKEITLLYGEKFKRFVKKIKGLEVNIDFLINGLVSRSTDAVWSFSYIKEHSIEKELDSLRFPTPERELLIAMKFHSGRLADIRDVIALMPCDKKRLKKHLENGSMEKLKESIKKQKVLIEKPQFSDSFKGIFGVFSYKEEQVRATKQLIDNILRQDAANNKRNK